MFGCTEGKCEEEIVLDAVFVENGFGGAQRRDTGDESDVLGVSGRPEYVSGRYTVYAWVESISGSGFQ